MRLEDYDYELPPERIAQFPAEPRDHSRLLVVDRKYPELRHHRFHELGEFLQPGDLLVLNETKVIPARLHARDQQGREFEVFVLSYTRCLVRPGKKLKPDTILELPFGVTAQISRAATEGLFEISFRDLPEKDFLPWLFNAGESPLPPYLKREATEADKISYQTVYAAEPGSVAAPTAGLHFTPQLLERLNQRGVQIAKVCLHVGYGTFSPLREETLDGDELHSEWYEVSEATQTLLRNTRQAGKRIVPVGTTALRSIESMSRFGSNGRTNLFIKPGYPFEWTDALVTNFHLPKSSLLVLVSALLGVERMRAVYRAAMENDYRFYSYGDAMLIL